MNLTLLPTACALSLGLLLAGCGTSPSNHYFVLSAHDLPPPAGERPSLGVGPVQVPEYLSRNNMVYNRAANTIEVAGLDMWAEPLMDGIQRVLLLNLAGLLNTQNVQSFPWQPGRSPDYAVRVNVLQLEATGDAVILNAEWLVNRPGHTHPVQRRVSRLQQPLVTDDPAAVAAAYSALLFQLSEIVAAAISADQAVAHTTTAP